MSVKKIKKFIDIPIHFKILIIMLFSTVFIIFIIFLTQELVLKKSFTDLENQYSRNDLERTENILNRELDYISQLQKDWSIWDDTYIFASDRNEEYIESNLQFDTFYSLSINFFYIFDINQNFVWGNYLDLENEKSIISDNFTREILSDKSIMFTRSELKNEDSEDLYRTGFWNSSEGLFLISTGPIVRSDNSGPPAGVLLMGRKLTTEFLDNIRVLTQNDFNIYTDRNESIINQIKTKDFVITNKFLTDLKGENSILIEVFTERSITEFGFRSLSTYRFSIIFLLFIVTTILIIIFQKAVSRPIHDLIRFLGESQFESLENIIPHLDRNDEIGYLANAINKFNETIKIQKEELMMMNGQLVKKASTDALTGLLNRHILESDIPIIWKSLTSNKKEISAILIDIDFFKKYNDTYGHQMGDECLETVADLLKKSLHRSSDMAIRYGGEEFLVLLPATPPVGAVIVAQTIERNLHEKKIKHKSSETSKYITVSMGLSTLLPDKSNNLGVLIEQADKALYESKKNGRNRFTIYKTRK